MIKPSNNRKILYNITEAFKSVIDNDIDENSSLSYLPQPSAMLNEYVRYINMLMKNRLKIGAASYGDEVPITKYDLKVWEERHGRSRDNLTETLEELVDALVYLSAESQQPLENTLHKLGNEYKQEINRSVKHLCLSVLHLLYANDNKVTYVNEIKEEINNG